MSIEDRALERLMDINRMVDARTAEDDEIGLPRAPRTDAEHRRVLGWGWDDPDQSLPGAS